MKTIIIIPVPPDGNNIYVLGIKDNIITYRRGFNPKQIIEEDFVIHNNMVCTALIYFPVQWLELIHKQK